MDTLPLIILGILFLLAIFDLVVGVSNDAVNFLNSAIGSKVAPRSVIVAMAAVGILLGSSLSGGMMEIARSGVFVPAQYSFSDIMLLFLAVMLSDVILLDLFNTFGMPTSTTVSLVFELLGAALAIAACHLWAAGDTGIAGLAHLFEYINTANAFKIISGIFSSVGVAFICGLVVMWISRAIFAFRYRSSYKRFGALWAGAALTAITYFAVFKGLKSSSLMTPGTLAALETNLCGYVLGVFAGWTALMLLCQFVFRVNVLKITVLAGTMALAMAFACNDLVNFIGVFMAAHASYGIAEAFEQNGGNVSTLMMGGLTEPVVAGHAWLIGAGLIMMTALFFSKKARTVTNTEVSLADTHGGVERFGSTKASRLIVRYVLNLIHCVVNMAPRPLARFIGRRFEPLPPEESDGAAFDLIRASVNLTVAALLISLATSLKLPLSTTYVTFMVSMGSSLADRAWGRDSAVYRITGVLTVVGGWFFTAFAAVTFAFVSALILFTCGWFGIVLLLAAVGAILVKSSTLHGGKSHRKDVLALDLANGESLSKFGVSTAETLGHALAVYESAVHGLMREDRKSLRQLRREVRRMSREIDDRRNFVVLPSLNGLPSSLVERGQCLFRVTESMRGTVESLRSIVQMSYAHIDNNHEGLSAVQARELEVLRNRVSKFYPELSRLLMQGDCTELDRALGEASDLSDEFAQAVRRHLLERADDVSQTRTGILYLNLLNETRSMIRRAYDLLKAQRELLHC